MKKTLTRFSFFAFLYFLFACFLLLPPAPVNAQQTFLWGRSGGSAETTSNIFDEESTRDVATDPNGNVYVLSPAGKLGMNIDGQSLTGFGRTDAAPTTMSIRNAWHQTAKAMYISVVLLRT